ncbi:MAG: hypothetical protein ACOCX2_09215 [Armatimonadota bacterium]
MLPWILAAAILGAGGPEGQLTVESGNLQATMGQANAWTIMTMQCDGMPVTVNSGGQGAVINPAGGDWTGGAMGGNTEQVQSLTINGEACTVAPEDPLTGEVTIVRESMLASVEQTSTTVFSDGVMRQTNELSFTEDINLGAFYPFIYSFSPEFTHWLAIRESGDAEVGEFTSEGGHRVNSETPAFALYNEALGRGVVVYLQQSPGGAVTLWDQTGYRKFWVQPTRGEIKAGTEFQGTMLLTCFDGGDDWQAAATSTFHELREAHPMRQADAQPNQLYDEGVPEIGFMTVATENLTVKFEAPSAWTIDEIRWNDVLVAGPAGHYGTVLVPKGGRWIGTGHTEGGREVVHSLSFSADGEQRPVEVGASLEGEQFELFKASTIHRFDAEHTVTVRGDEIVERALLTATEDHELNLMYLFMHCIEPGSTAWMAELPDGTFEEGVLDSDDEAASAFELRKPARWVAQHFPEQDLSVLLYLTRIPTPDDTLVQIWDLPRYHKFYVTHNRGLAVSEGDEIDHTLVFTVVEGETGDWSATKARAEQLEEAYPPEDAE